MHKFRPNLEPLDDRNLLATNIWTGVGNGVLAGNDPDNWSLERVPVAGDTLVFAETFSNAGIDWTSDLPTTIERIEVEQGWDEVFRTNGHLTIKNGYFNDGTVNLGATLYVGDGTTASFLYATGVTFNVYGQNVATVRVQHAGVLGLGTVELNVPLHNATGRLELSAADVSSSTGGGAISNLFGSETIVVMGTNHVRVPFVNSGLFYQEGAVGVAPTTHFHKGFYNSGEVVLFKGEVVFDGFLTTPSNDFPTAGYLGAPGSKIYVYSLTTVRGTHGVYTEGDLIGVRHTQNVNRSDADLFTDVYVDGSWGGAVYLDSGNDPRVTNDCNFWFDQVESELDWWDFTLKDSTLFAGAQYANNLGHGNYVYSASFDAVGTTTLVVATPGGPPSQQFTFDVVKTRFQMFEDDLFDLYPYAQQLANDRKAIRVTVPGGSGGGGGIGMDP